MAISEYYAQIRRKLGGSLILVPGVAAIIRDETGRFLFWEKARRDLELAGWSDRTRAGNPAQAIVREVQEETGLGVKARSSCQLTTAIPIPRAWRPGRTACVRRPCRAGCIQRFSTDLRLRRRPTKVTNFTVIRSEQNPGISSCLVAPEEMAEPSAAQFTSSPTYGNRVKESLRSPSSQHRESCQLTTPLSTLS